MINKKNFENNCCQPEPSCCQSEPCKSCCSITPSFIKAKQQNEIKSIRRCSSFFKTSKIDNNKIEKIKSELEQMWLNKNEQKYSLLKAINDIMNIIKNDTSEQKLIGEKAFSLFCDVYIKEGFYNKFIQNTMDK